ncbi:MAG: hypothetical protein HYZ38_22060 [Mycobacterium sp.]|nr:hypothetical protein [Mycobacterium sp.]
MRRSRRLLVSAGVAAMIAVLSCGYATADDDDDDDDSGHSSSNVESWPPTTVSWPPFSAPDESGTEDDNSVTLAP